MAGRLWILRAGPNPAISLAAEGRRGRGAPASAYGRQQGRRVSSPNLDAFPHPSLAAPRPPEILGIPLAVSDYEQVMDWMEAMIAAGARDT